MVGDKAQQLYDECESFKHHLIYSSLAFTTIPDKEARLIQLETQIQNLKTLQYELSTLKQGRVITFTTKHNLKSIFSHYF